MKSFNKSIFKNASPKYPLVALRKGWQGKVLISVLVSANGSTQKVTVLGPSPFKVLDQSAVRAAMNWKFKPDLVGKAYLVKKEVIFKIN